MARASRAELRFVRALISAGAAKLGDRDTYRVGDARLRESDARQLAASGVLELRNGRCAPRPEARTWLRRQMLEPDDLAAQHRLDSRTPAGARLNLAESPLSRLAVAAAGESAPYLERHQVEAGERVRRLAERAQLQPRVTMSYSGAHTAGRKGPGHAAEITDMAAEARAELSRLHRVLPRDCADVILDVCGLQKGLQVVETERGWPRRSAKLVLRIGLEHLAQHFGYGPAATGPETSRRPRAWLDEGARPDRFE